MRAPRDARAAAAVFLLLVLAVPAAARAEAPSTPSVVRQNSAGGRTRTTPAVARPKTSSRVPTPRARAAPRSTPPAGAAAPPPTPGTLASPYLTPTPTPTPTPVTGTAGSPIGPDPNAQGGSLTGPGPLVSNGLGSPSCRDARLRVQLSAIGRANCAASGVAVASAPLENYQFDVHIDNGLIGTSGETVLQSLVLKPVWMALVWLTDAAVVALEWCFALDLLGSGTLGPVTRGLQSMRDALTTPWLAPVLAIAAVAVVYNGIVRRRVVDTVGQFALLMAMMAGGLWVIADPSGTVGAASRLVNQASLGTLGAAATGDPDHGQRSLDDALRPLFAETVTGPWCYLEFGAVDWCRLPDRLDPALVVTARAIVAHDRAAARGQAERRAVQVEADEIAGARTNGELFLALPNNGPRRNSINADAASPSLLHTLCGGDDTGSCPASTGPQAEFRTKAGTFARLGGLLLIAIGAVGMFALVGFICLRLLGTVLLALLYLLLAPVAVLAPALGDGGRDVFRRWSLRLLGAILAKLVYSVFLGVVLLMVRILAELEGLGWWTQWLLIAMFWWLVFNHRHRMLENVIHERAEPTRRGSLANRLFATRQALKLAAPPAKALVGMARRRGEALRGLGTKVSKTLGKPTPEEREVAGATRLAQTLEHDHATAVGTVARAPAIESELAGLRARAEQIGRARPRAAAAGDRRRTISLQRRAHDVQAQITVAEADLAAARATVSAGTELRRQTGLVHDGAQRTARAELLDRQAKLPPRLARKGKRGERRDYAQLTSLVRLGRGDYERLSAADRRRTDLAIDRELESWRKDSKQIRKAKRRQVADRRGDPTSRPDPRPVRRPVSRRERQFDRRGSHAESGARRDRGRSGDRRP